MHDIEYRNIHTITIVISEGMKQTNFPLTGLVLIETSKEILLRIFCFEYGTVHEQKRNKQTNEKKKCDELIIRFMDFIESMNIIKN